jgi:predicted neutral ceramidase superfamily lipid hydrolase
MNINYPSLKLGLPVAVLVATSEIVKLRSVRTMLLAMLSLTALLAFVWLCIDAKDARQVAALLGEIFWLAIPSLALFPGLAVLLRSRVTLWLAMAGVVALTLLAYAATVYSSSVFCFKVRKPATDAHYFS